MSPIIELQRRMVEVGRIRAGEFDGHPKKLDKWRLTSKDRTRLAAAAKLWGGEVKVWERGEGFELYTETAELPIMLLPGQGPTTWYELWSKGGCQRRCDGVHEMVSDAACICGDPRECKATTRLPVILPDLPGVGSWLLTSTGFNAARELPGTADLLLRASGQGVLVPARLRLEQRKEVKAGQTLRYAVPVIDVDVSVRDLLGAQGALSTAPETRALPSGYTPIDTPKGNGVSLEQGLQVAETQELKRGPRSAAPIPQVDEIPFGEGPVPVAVKSDAAVGEVAGSGSAPSLGEPERAASGTSEKPLTLAEAKKKMNALVGQLREGGHITTAQLYQRMASERGLEVDHMIALIEGARDEKGELHWAPLRDTLSRDEANALHGRLARLWVNVQDDGA